MNGSFTTAGPQPRSKKAGILSRGDLTSTISRLNEARKPAIEASAVVCANGVVRAGCAGARGAVVVRKHAEVCRTVVVNGARVRRCT